MSTQPVSPPLAPVAWMRASASAEVVQVIEVPGELTRGRAAQTRPPLQPVLTNLPPTHWAKPPLTQAFSPAKSGGERQAEYGPRVY